jgi:hypothetical protein
MPFAIISFLEIGLLILGGVCAGFLGGIIVTVARRRCIWKRSPVAQYALLLAATAPEEWDHTKLSHPDIGRLTLKHKQEYESSWWEAAIGNTAITREQANTIKRGLEDSRVRMLSRQRIERIGKELQGRLKTMRQEPAG